MKRILIIGAGVLEIKIKPGKSSKPITIGGVPELPDVRPVFTKVADVAVDAGGFVYTVDNSATGSRSSARTPDPTR